MRRKTLSEFGVLAVLFVLAVSTWGFIEIVDEVLENETHAVDRAILSALRSDHSPVWLLDAVRDITALGSVSVLTLVVAIAAVFLMISGHVQTAAFVIVATAGGTAVMSGLKTLFDRPRPDAIPHDFLVTTASFPSGHAMISAVVYLTLGGLISRVVEGGQKIYVIGAAVLLTALVGISRLYLGVHWPTDVLAGWSAGAAWAMLCWLVTWIALRER